MRIVFIGSTKFGLLCLKKVQAISKCNIVGIITGKRKFAISYRPRGVDNINFADFNEAANKFRIPIITMNTNMLDPQIEESLRKWDPDFIIVVGWYHMIPKKIRNSALTVGLHSSLLPNYRGGAPLVWAIINGERKTGISLFVLGDGVDDGDIIGQLKEKIYFNDSIASLSARIEKKGLMLLEEFIPKIINNNVKLVPQHYSSRIMPQRGPEDGLINWNADSRKLYNFIRAQTKPYPGAFTFFNKRKIIIWKASLPSENYFKLKKAKCEPGTIMGFFDNKINKGILIAAAKKSKPIFINSVGIKNNNIIPALKLKKIMKLKEGLVFG